MGQITLTEVREALAVLNQYHNDFDVKNAEFINREIAFGRSKRLRELANSHLKNYLARRELIGADLSSEYCWAVLICLYVARCDSLRTCVTDIVYSTGIPPATVIRWLALLTSRGLVVRSPDRNDARRTWVVLDDTAVALIEKCLGMEASGTLPVQTARR